MCDSGAASATSAEVQARILGVRGTHPKLRCEGYPCMLAVDMFHLGMVAVDFE